VVVDGELISKLPDLHASTYRAKSIGFIFQHFNLIESLSVEENIYAPIVHIGLDIERIRDMAKRVMIEASIEHKADQSIRDLSGGEKQRCAIARALVRDPKLIICDEPTANLDRANSMKFIDILSRLHSRGKSIVVATHDPLFKSLPFPSRVIEMEDGVIVEG
jgi:putative ABC transport system ATP-binding protein